MPWGKKSPVRTPDGRMAIYEPPLTLYQRVSQWPGGFHYRYNFWYRTVFWSMLATLPLWLKSQQLLRGEGNKKMWKEKREHYYDVGFFYPVRPV